MTLDEPLGHRIGTARREDTFLSQLDRLDLTVASMEQINSEAAAFSTSLSKRMADRAVLDTEEQQYRKELVHASPVRVPKLRILPKEFAKPDLFKLRLLSGESVTAFNGGMEKAGAFNATRGKRAAKVIQRDEGRIKKAKGAKTTVFEEPEDIKWYMAFMADFLPVSDIKKLKHVMDGLTRVQRDVIVGMHEKVIDRFMKG